ncbi:MAG TPA: type II toxin-antitoxin system prevent-host-death family antitoxin [Solirubrobacteraceae bacterium]|jgi:prevent-host-death family protein|nr:type II toxin-antitoxin system prevent-host-death family antitoxin [Solirubrobacteraceae bacterium]
MSEPISISEAKTQLSKLVARAERGEEITIRRGKTPVVRLVAISPPQAPARSPVGALRGQIWISDDVDELGPEWDPYL